MQRGRGQPLIPWPNRIGDGHYEYDGTPQQLALTEPETHNAIHGLMRWANWTVCDRAGDRIVADRPPLPGGRRAWPADRANRRAGTRFDYTEARELGQARLDTAYTDLARDDDGLARVQIATADSSRRATLWMDGAYQYLMLFTGDTLPVDARRHGSPSNR